MTQTPLDERLEEPSDARANGGQGNGNGDGAASEELDHLLLDPSQEECPVHLQRIIETQQEIAAADLDLHSVMELICERTQELTGADGSSILFLDGDALIHRAGTGSARHVVGEHVPIDGTFTGSVYRRNRSGICNDTSVLPTQVARERGIHALIAVPLRRGDDTVGLLTVLSEATGTFTAQDLGTLELLSVVLSAAISHSSELEARRAQVEALARFRTVFEGAAIGIVRCDREGHTLEANPALERMLGYSATELASMRFKDITHPDDVDHNLGLFQELMEGKRDSYQLEKRYLRKEGGLIWGQVTAVLERDERRPSRTRRSR